MDEIDDFLAGLEQDAQKPVRKAGLLKVGMNAKCNQGTIVFAPYKDSSDGKFYKKVEKVKEYSCNVSLFKNGEEPVKVKILPKEFYGELTPTESTLYDEVSGLFDQVDAFIGDIPNKYQTIGTRNYALFQGYVLNHVPSDGSQSELTGKPALLKFPQTIPVTALGTAVNGMMATMGGDKSWIPAVMCPNNEGREGALQITFNKGNIGYDCSVSIVMNSRFSSVVDPKGYPEEVVSLFGDMIEEFLGWENGEGKKFNEALFLELKKVFLLKLGGQAAPKPVEAPENKNGKDPMVSAPAVAAEPAEPVAPSAPAGKGKGDLPF